MTESESRIAYGDYQIEPTPHQLNGAGAWTQWLRVSRAARGGRDVQIFTGAATFPTRAKAVAACVQFGRDIIDGKLPNRAVRF